MAGIVVKPRSRIFHGHDWVYASEIHKTFGDPNPGDVVSLKDFKDRSLGVAIYNPRSQIVARRISRRKEELNREFFVRRIQRAQEYRESLQFADPFYRIAWSEADGLPGVVADRYGDSVVLQTLTLAMDQRIGLLVEALQEVFGPATVVERNDSPVRKAEGLDLKSGLLSGSDPGAVTVPIGAGLTQTADLLKGQKTGVYLDQLDNYLAVAVLAKNRSVLDCFSNQGGFALHCAKAGASRVRAVDISEDAVESVRANAATNGLEIETSVANVFDFLKQSEKNGDQYDMVILDPPSFTRNRKKLNDALRGYKEIHLRALKLLRTGGRLVTFCCSHHVSQTAFHETIRDASVDAKRTLRFIDHYTQRSDHPVISTIPETAYLKGFAFELIGAF